MKRFLTIMTMALMAMAMLTSCSSDEPKDSTINANYDFLGSYIGYDESDGRTYDLTSLTIRANGTFTHEDIDLHLGYREQWHGEWTYSEKANVITLRYLTGKIMHGGEVIEAYPIEDDYCWAQPYEDGNKLRYKEHWDDAWEEYMGFIKTSYKY